LAQLPPIAGWQSFPASLAMLRWLLAVLLLVLGLLQYRLWIAEGSLAEMKRLQRQVVEQTAVNQELQARNEVLEREVLNLQNGNDGVEQRAREQLGLIREGEVFYQFVDKDERNRAASSREDK
jgi:cell division protein FtsB